MRMNGAMRTLKSNYGDIDGDSEHGVGVGGGYHIQPGTGVYLPQGITQFYVQIFHINSYPLYLLVSLYIYAFQWPSMSTTTTTVSTLKKTENNLALKR